VESGGPARSGGLLGFGGLARSGESFTMFASVALIGTAASGGLFGSVFLVPAAVMRPGGWGVVPGIRVALRRPRVFRRWWVQHSRCMLRLQVRPPRPRRARRQGWV